MRWTPESWREKPAAQQAEYDDPEELERVLAKIRRLPKIVTSWEVERLKSQLAEVCRGERFLLQGGDCSERFEDCHPHIIDAKLKVLLMMGAVLVHGAGRPVVRVGRIAGQYAKPRSSPTETRNGVTLPSYRGDLVNGPEFTPEARRPDPQRLLEGHARAAMTLNFIRGLLSGGFGDVHHPEVWDLSFVKDPTKQETYQEIAHAIADAVRFTEAMVGRRLEELAKVDFFTSHEGLHLPYEHAMGEHPPLRDRWYDLGTHFPWIGDRTRSLDGAHVEYFRGVGNPVGCKVGPTMEPEELVDLCRVLNPDNEPGKLVLIHRMGVDRVEELLPPLVAAVRDAGLNVVWCCDPMHGNTYKTAEGYKTRHFDAILGEVERSFAIHEDAGTILGGVHFEMTGENVTEVVGGAGGLTEKDLPRRYLTDVDPRLNHEQSLELAFLIARHMRGTRRRRACRAATG